ncbi:MAG: class I SAM-dependent methyltransferase [Oscillospiraceae bacterium]|jgi:ubiquinone/menaquinone biosynthesis C-methylase UbiE|nr:class I SAM-dependent methyltransferase [Oscillospiraceae bacterium]
MTDKTNHPGGLNLTRRAVRLTGVFPPARVLDIGCGEGASVNFLKKLGYQALGVSENAEKLPFDAETFEIALFECVLSCIENSEFALSEAFRVLKNDGVIIISDIFNRNFIGEFLEKLKNCGFEAFFTEDHTPALVTYFAELREFPRETYYSGNLENTGYFLILGRKI